MSLSDPTTWVCPSDWHQDCDGVWEFEQLRTLALAITSHRESWIVRLVYDDPTVVHTEVLRSNKKIGEAYVNRAAADRLEPVFSVYAGAEGEYHGGSVAEAVRCFEAAIGAWREDER
ncbi:MAG: hypothetical protein DWQ34_28595 [Planctomycetota bacterium]|nr:MAG: hypothetical protein DWQ34_28595 [Planctomycetota bacterium]REJ91088.1 MAG: hypothetical protein DWQ29_06030 [Planctomycetota bacterium]REK21406.1 MAG: hypothetical protein DWQ41_21475 [Planctomycetota bacterium]REK40083.1 MAG: hypothetical protein DWQ45_00570 [Planctomycetota bacterium]